MFNSLQARMMRTAISPRLATRTFSNMDFHATWIAANRRNRLCSRRRKEADLAFLIISAMKTLIWPQFEKGLPKLHWFGIFDQNLRNYPLRLGFDLIHHLHRLDNAHHGLGINLRPNFDVRCG